jgi:hypothetical protein
LKKENDILMKKVKTMIIKNSEEVLWIF